mmetsp:Transcript_10643/g.28406  ORF Transcript_10643/g.28406 Transcript_10643/m.28406 type:complete len:162 (+) Transcript_10643:344-829(+)
MHSTEHVNALTTQCGWYLMSLQTWQRALFITQRLLSHPTFYSSASCTQHEVTVAIVAHDARPNAHSMFTFSFLLLLRFFCIKTSFKNIDAESGKTVSMRAHTPYVPYSASRRLFRSRSKVDFSAPVQKRICTTKVMILYHWNLEFSAVHPFSQWLTHPLAA